MSAGGGGGRLSTQLLMLSSKLPKSQIPYVHWGWGGDRVSTQLLVLSPKLPKTQIHVSDRGWWRAKGVNPMFDAESKTAYNPNFICPQERGRVSSQLWLGHLTFDDESNYAWNWNSLFERGRGCRMLTVWDIWWDFKENTKFWHFFSTQL